MIKRPRIQLPETGTLFGRLVFLAEGPRIRITPDKPKGIRSAKVKCTCGVIKLVDLYALQRGTVQSCGCWRTDCKCVEMEKVLRATKATRVVCTKCNRTFTIQEVRDGD